MSPLRRTSAICLTLALAACADVEPMQSTSPTWQQTLDMHRELSAAPLRPGNGHDTWDAEAFRYENLHGTEFTPGARIARGGAVTKLPYALRSDIGRTIVQTRLGQMSVDRFVDTFPMDGVLMIHRGRIVYERYPRMRDTDTHQIYSVSKIIPALLIAELVDQGRVDPRQPIETYIPALAATEWRGVLVQNILDMATGMEETGLEDPSWEAQFWESQFNRLSPSPYDLVAHMRRDAKVPQGTDFQYATRNTFVLAWLLEAVWQQPFASIVSQRLWRHIGAEHDAFMGVSPGGAPHTEFAMTLRDLGRVGLLYVPDDNRGPNEARVSQGLRVSPRMLERMQRDGRPELLRGLERDLNERGFDHEPVHHNGWQWDAVFADGSLFKAGYGGQGLLVSPRHHLVVAFVSSWPAMDRQDYNRFQWIARQLIHAGAFR